MLPEHVIKLFWAKVVKSDGCWLWTASLQKTGYGNAWNGRSVETAHRLSYRIHKGDIPPGLDVMHSCDVRHCVNPEHLALGDRAANMRDAQAKGRLVQEPVTVCKHGHSFTPENTLVLDRGDGRTRRQCRTCNRERMRARYIPRKH